jgi:hypothetical protein
MLIVPSAGALFQALGQPTLPKAFDGAIHSNEDLATP